MDKYFIGIVKETNHCYESDDISQKYIVSTNRDDSHDDCQSVIDKWISSHIAEVEEILKQAEEERIRMGFPSPVDKFFVKRMNGGKDIYFHRQSYDSTHKCWTTSCSSWYHYSYEYSIVEAEDIQAQ